VTVTLAPVCVTLPFQIWVTVWPFAKLQVSDQLVHAVVPVLLMLNAAPNPPDHWLEIE